MNRNDISQILESMEKFENVLFVVRDDSVWISGSHAKSTLVAKRMTEHLVYEEDIPCGLPYVDPPEGRFSGVAFNWYDPAELKDVTVWTEGDYAGSGSGDWYHPSIDELELVEE